MAGEGAATLQARGLRGCALGQAVVGSVQHFSVAGLSATAGIHGWPGVDAMQCRGGTGGGNVQATAGVGCIHSVGRSTGRAPCQRDGGAGDARQGCRCVVQAPLPLGPALLHRPPSSSGGFHTSNPPPSSSITSITSITPDSAPHCVPSEWTSLGPSLPGLTLHEDWPVMLRPYALYRPRHLQTTTTGLRNVPRPPRPTPPIRSAHPRRPLPSSVPTSGYLLGVLEQQIGGPR